MGTARSEGSGTRPLGYALLALLYCLTAGLGTAKATSPTSGSRYWFYGDLRYRFEYQNNFNARYYGRDPQTGAAADSFLLQRIRAGFHYQLSDYLELAAGVQDARAWGLEPGDDAFYKSNLGLINHPYKDYTEPYETWLKLHNLGGLDLSLTAGRQSIRYGDNRIFGSRSVGQYRPLSLGWAAPVLGLRQQLCGCFLGRPHHPRTRNLESAPPA